jgi:hypothetical protein
MIRPLELPLSTLLSSLPDSLESFPDVTPFCGATRLRTRPGVGGECELPTDWPLRLLLETSCFRRAREFYDRHPNQVPSELPLPW